MPNTLAVTLDDVLAAREVLADVLTPTPMELSRALSDRTGLEVHLKCENLQRAGSFKMRGAYTRMSRLTEEERSRGVVAASAGNHAQGVALAARLLGIEATVYMPHGAAMPKLAATRGYGATVIQVGTTIDECISEALRHEAETGAVFVPPFDHKDIVAGQGTCGLEILEQVPDVRTILVCTGGGGLLAGIAAAVKALRPDVKVVGVQAAEAAAWPASLAAGHPVPVSSMSTMADGIAVGRPGDVPFGVVAELVDGMETVGEDSIARAVLQLVERAKLVVEPAGAAATAHLMDLGQEAAERYEGPVVAVLSGGNIDPLLLLRILRTGLTVAGRYLQLRVRVPDRPGELAAVLTMLAEQSCNVLEVQHHRRVQGLKVSEVSISMTLETSGHDHSARVVQALRDRGYTVDPL
ncbi:threonine ammonia-lyase [Ornithinimicrobium tianjinense]|uniref:threonine ammonia-lyase n=1 Tax=Ornithinimicrobium tianjinense TaxID=1195761 RepID=A0A917F2Q4_9MICO|nr:threonine ammonia-lyase [Ornithinimicrobium tianjinense]GGF39067.1 threonine ammonia-lyase [Ornithinimicrobium tianjinense]